MSPQRDASGVTLTGVLIQHRGHTVTSDTEYRVPSGRVYGTPHLILRCTTCNAVIWDEAIEQQTAPGRRKPWE